MWEQVEGLPEWVNDLCAERWQVIRFIWEDSLAGEDCSELFLEWDRLDMELKGWIS